MKRRTGTGRKSVLSRLRDARPQGEIPGIVFYLLAALYATVSICLSRVSRSGQTLTIFGGAIPLQSLSGVLSPLANICIVFLVVFFRKTGFYTAIALLALQFPMLVKGIAFDSNLTAIPGMCGNIFTIVAIVLIYRRNRKIEEYRTTEVENLKVQQEMSKRLFEQTVTALVNAIDAKDAYSHGHSMRVAKYSQKIAQMMGKDEAECLKVYYAAMLHDVGKIGIPGSIINKKENLTPEEYEIIKQHPVMGNQILSSISDYPYLSIGAHYHHERYDGTGYPDGLKGEAIPELARIIAVADAYDTMASHRTYRDTVPQDVVREEIVKGGGTQFDPQIAKIMRHLIDLDTEYRMKEWDSAGGLGGKNEIHCDEPRSEISDGIIVTRKLKKIHLKAEADGTRTEKDSGPAILLFDSLDGRAHNDEKSARETNYFEYCEIRMNGDAVAKGARKVQTRTNGAGQQTGDTGIFDIEAVKCRDHVLIRIRNGMKTAEATAALPDSSRYVYIGLTGAYCHISDIRIEETEEAVPPDYIPRIAEEVSYITGPQGDVPNLQADGYRTETSAGIPLWEGLTVRFHSQSLPTARLIWHCPFFVVFTSDDGTVNGGHYREYALLRLDGEDPEGGSCAENRLTVTRQDGFGSWDTWKQRNKAGYDGTARFERKGDIITFTTENLGLLIRNTTTILDEPEKVYVALTGDQCALTNIRLARD